MLSLRLGEGEKLPGTQEEGTVAMARNQLPQTPGTRALQLLLGAGEKPKCLQEGPGEVPARWLPAAEGEGASSALRCAALAGGGWAHRPELQGKRQAQATGSSSPLATGRGSHAPRSGVTAPELGRKRGEG